MQDFIKRLSWNNLPLRFKTGAIFVTQIILVGLMALAGFVALGNIGAAVSRTAGTVVELRSLANNLQTKIEDLGHLEDVTMVSFLQPGFDPTTTNIQLQHRALVAEIKADASRIVVLSQQLGSQIEPGVFGAQASDVAAEADKSQENFNRLFNPITQLTTPQTGALPILHTYGQQLQDLTIQRGNPELIAEAVTITSLESAFLSANPTDQQRVGIHTAVQNYITTYTTIVPRDQWGQELPLATLYNDRIDGVYDLLQQTQNTYQAAQLQVSSLRTSGSRLGTLSETQTAAPVDALAAVIGQAQLLLAAGLLVAVVAGSIVTNLFSRSLLHSVQALLSTARRLQAGDMRARVSVTGNDEFSELGTSYNAMAVQMDGLISGLEQRVAERARDLSITADIGRAVVALPDPRDLMNEIVELIRQRFGFYHAQIFLVDDAGKQANLVASTGTAGRELLARRHSLPIGSQSVIGQVTSRSEPLIASDTDSSTVHQRNELLPDTRSEMALPMRIGDRVIGALDVQSVAPNAFEADSVAVFQIMADQLAMALENARLYARLQDAERNMDVFQRKVTREAWNAYQGNRDLSAPAAFRLSQDKTEVQPGPPLATLSEAISAGQLTTLDNGQSDIGLAVPIRVRGEVIGAFGFGGETIQNLTEEDIALVEAVVDRVGLALENIRLVEQTTRRAEHEQVVNEITSKIVGSTDINFILQTTVKELGRVLRAPQTSVQLRRERTDTSHE